MSDWTHLARIVHKGVPTYAHLVDPKEDGSLAEQFEVEIVTGNPIYHDIKRTGEIVTVARAELLSPLSAVPIVINTGLNYKDHVTESLFAAPPDLYPPMPYIFYRPGTSIAPPYPTLLRTYKIQQECLDYEGEMVFVTSGQPLKDLTVEEAKKHIIGFTVGLDFSPRPGKVLGRMNYIFSKGFDDFTPTGPVLVNPAYLGTTEPELNLTTKWNGKVVQSDNSRNMIFKAAEILASMSTGTTVKPGTVVFSGTCGGGAWFASQGAAGTGINDGDEVEVTIERLGTIRAYPRFDK